MSPIRIFSRWLLMVISASGFNQRVHAQLPGLDPIRKDVLELRLEDSTDANAKILLPAKVGDQVTLWINEGEKYRKRRFVVGAIKTERQIHFAYIYLDGSKLTLSRIDSLRDMIIAQLEQGVRFDTLATRYSMDGNKTGELPWAREEMYIEEFRAAVRPRKRGEVFKVDEPSHRWYHVVKKLDDDRIVPIYILWKR